MDGEKVALVSNLQDDVLRSRNRSRLFISFILCSIPASDACFILFCLTRKSFNRFFGTTNLFFFLYVLILIATTVVGYYGIFGENQQALRASITLFTVQNFLVLLITINLFWLFLSYKNFFMNHHAPPFMGYLDAHRGLGIFLFVLNILARLANVLLTWLCGELEATFEVVNRIKNGRIDFKRDGDQFQIDIKDDFEQIY